MARAGVTVVQKFLYRGADEEFSNQFHFPGSPPSDHAGWDALCAAFVTKWKACLTVGGVTILRIYCYTDTDNDSVYTYDLADHGGTVAGTGAVGTGTGTAPGDAAYWIRWATGRTNSKGKAVYLRKYCHNAHSLSGSSDALDTTFRTNVATAAAALTPATGAWPGVCGPSYDLPASPAILVSQYITTRTLKRRGKRP